METSAREHVNIEETFEVLIRKVVDARQARANPTRVRNSSVERMSKGSSPMAYGMKLRGQVGEKYVPFSMDGSTMIEKQEGDKYGRRRWLTRLKCW